MHHAYLGLGSNLGDRLANLRAALARLRGVRACSSVYETEALTVEPQPAFYNAVVEVEVEEGPRALLQRCLALEAALGRRRTTLQAPRIIDVDLLLYDELVAAWPELVLPHPALAHRAFVLRPLAELAPGLRDPRDGRVLHDLLAVLERTQRMRRIGSLAEDRGS